MSDRSYWRAVYVAAVQAGASEYAALGIANTAIASSPKRFAVSVVARWYAAYRNRQAIREMRRHEAAMARA